MHPDSVYDHPRAIVADQTISIGEKRAILASWASDAASGASKSALREVPGSHRRVTIDEVLEGLSALGNRPKGPPGGKPVRRNGLASWHGSIGSQRETTMLDEKFALLRTHRNNISRYRRLLKTSTDPSANASLRNACRRNVPRWKAIRSLKARITICGRSGERGVASIFSSSTPLGHLPLSLGEERPVTLSLQHWQQTLKGRFDIPGQADLDRVTQTDPVGFDPTWMPRA